MNDDKKTQIINRWCRLFKVTLLGNRVMTIMDVEGFRYPSETFISVSAALEESYTRAHAHTWTVCKHIEDQRKYEREHNK